jgi:hypothetical protein
VTRRRRGIRLGVSLLVALATSACSRACQKQSDSTEAGPKKVERMTVGFAKRLDAPAFVEVSDTKGLGVPPGCHLAGAVRRATFGPERLRFVAPRRELGSLALAEGAGDSGKSTERAALLNARDGTVTDVPWAELDAPPLFDKAASGWVAAWAISADSEMRALLWRGGSEADVLVQGYDVDVADVSCRGDDCLVLTSLARTTAAPGASVLSGNAKSPASSFTRVDIEPGDDEPWEPLTLADADGARFVSLSSGRHAALYRLDAGRAERLGTIDAPHGAWEAVATPEPVVVMPGADVGGPCGSEAFPIVIQGAKGERHEIRTPAPPESVIARPLGKGALLAWVAPVSCALLQRRIVYVALLGPGGAPKSSPMAMGDATGFSLSVAGSRASLWLLQDRDLTWMDLECEVPK